MRCIKHVVKAASLDRKFCLIAGGDNHIGNSGCDEAQISQALRGANFYLGMGDDIEGILPHDKRWNSKSIAPWLWKAMAREDTSGLIALQCDRAVHHWKAALHANRGSRLLGVLESNHPRKIARDGAFDPTAYICKQLNTPNLGNTTQIHITFVTPKKSCTYAILATHGWGGGCTKGNKLHKLHMWASRFSGYDLYLMGHGHEQLIAGKTSLYSTPSKIGDKNALLVMTGTTLKTYTDGSGGYGEQFGYEPTTLGYPKIYFHPASHNIEASIGAGK